MNLEDDLQLLSVYESLCDLPVDEALAKLAAIGLAPDLERRLRAMLVADDEDVSFLDSNAPERLADALARDLVESVASAPAPDQHPIVPARLGPYRVLGLLGSGAMGMVYEAEQAQPLRRVAIKVVRGTVEDDASRARFRHEAQVLATLRHPAIPYVVEAAEYHGIGYVVMERVVGERLDIWVQGRTVDEVLEVVLQLCGGVAHAHAAGVLHRDLKPANILVEADGQPRILDFGLAVLVETATQAALGGTLPYLPPEALDGEFDQRGDVYALGVVLFELLDHRLPWNLDGLTVREALRFKRDAPVQASSAVPPPLAAIAQRALAPDPADRYPSVQALVDDLSAYLAHEPVSAWKAPPRARLQRWLRRHAVAVRWSLASGLALAVLLGAATGTRAALDAASESRRQEAAWARQQSVVARVDELRLQGHHDQAEAVFNAFAEMPENADTDALAWAWVDQAARLAADGRDDERLDALAHAFTIQVNPALRAEVSRQLARAFSERLDWTALEILVAHVDDPALRASFQTRIDLGQRRLPSGPVPGLSEGLGEVLAGWSHGLRTPWRPIWSQSTDWPDGGERLLMVDQDAQKLVVADPSAVDQGVAVSLPGIRYGWDTPRVVTIGGVLWMVALKDQDEPLWELWRLDLEDPELHFESVLTGDRGVPSPMAVADLDGDGQPRIYLGSGPPERRVRVFDPADPVLRVPHRGSDAAASDVSDVLAADLDGDGSQELVLALGPWQAFDVRVLDVPPGGSEDDELRLRARRQLGGTTLISTLRRPGGHRVLVVSKADNYPSEKIFGDAQPYGDPIGLYLLRLDGDRLVQEHFLPMPGKRVNPVRSFTGDLDGDGLDDLVVKLEAFGQSHAWVLKQHADGEFEQVLIGGLSPLGLVQADDDPALELLARIGDDDEHLWVLGGGDQPVPARRARADVARTNGASRAEVLQSLGLREAAAELLEQQARAEGRRPRGLAWWRQAAELRAELGDYPAAIGDLEHARAVVSMADETDAALLLDIVELALAGARPGVAREALQTLERHPAGGAHAAQVRARLDALGIADGARVGLDMRRAATLDWLVDDPAAVRATPEGLELRLLAGEGSVLRLPLERTGGPLGMRAVVDVSRTDPGAIALFRLRPTSAAFLPGLSLHPWGGSRRVDRSWSCLGPGHDVRLLTHEPLRVLPTSQRFAMRMMSLAGKTRCEVRQDGKLDLISQLDVEVPDSQDWELQIAVDDSTFDEALGEVTLTLLELELEGLRPVSGPSTPGLDWLRGASAEAVQALGAADPAMGAVLAAELGELDVARARTRALADAHPERVPVQLVQAMRRRPGVWLPLVHESWSAAAYSDAYLRAWRAALTGPADVVARSAIDHPYLDDLVVDEGSIEVLVALAELMDLAGRRPAARSLLARVVESAPPAPLLLDLAAIRLAAIEAREGMVESAVARCRARLDASPSPELVMDQVLLDDVLREVCGGLAAG